MITTLDILIKAQKQEALKQGILEASHAPQKMVLEADVDFVLYGQSKYPDRTIDEMGGRYKEIWDVIETEYTLIRP